MKILKNVRIMFVSIIMLLMVGIFAVPTQAAVPKYQISKTYTKLAPDESTFLILRDDKDNYVEATWLSYNEEKASVRYPKGSSTKVTAVSQEDARTTIAAYVNGQKVATCVVEIDAIEYSIKSAKDKNTISTGETMQLKLVGSNGKEYPVHWISYNTDKATVGKTTGIVKGVTGDTQTTIAAYVDGKKVATFPIYIENFDYSIEAATNTVSVGRTLQLKVVGNNGGEYQATWISYNTDKATVGKTTGIVKGIKAGTQTTIAAYVNGKKVAAMPIYVKNSYTITSKDSVLASFKNPNGKTVTLQKAWEYGPTPGFKDFFKFLSRNENGSSYTFKDFNDYKQSIEYYQILTNDLDVLYRNDLYYTNGKYEFVLTADSDNVKYTNGQKGMLNYIKKSYNSLSAAGVRNGMNKKDAYKKIADYISKITRYDNSFTYDHVDGIYDHGTTVCLGYTELVQLMCNQAGIYCDMVWGYSANSTQGSSHIWNRVNLGGERYYSDITWYDTDKANKFDTKYYLSSGVWSDHSALETYTFAERGYYWN